MDLITTTERTQRSAYLVKNRFQPSVNTESITAEPITSDPISHIPIIHVQGAKLHAITEKQCVDIVMDELNAGRAGSIVTMNLDHLRRFVKDGRYRVLCKKATLHVADGMPLVWASRLQGTPLPERVTGSNLIWSLSEAAAKNGRSVFLLGGQPGTAQETANILQTAYEGLKIAGTYYPPHGFENEPDYINQMAQAVIDAQPDIIYVALGSPKQEKLIEKLRQQLPTVWWLGVGISFSFVSGYIPRAPRWMQAAGLEWLHRLMQEPRRLADRYLVHGFPFFLSLLARSLFRRFI